jgi:tetratricopeptide (TPR) repeat protein
LLARPETERVLIIGLGGGRTLAAVPPPVREIDLIELELEVVQANRRVVEIYGLRDPLDDPRLTLRIGDARGALMLTGRNYDAIISQPSHPWTSGASHLYTQEFFSLIKERLVPGGVFVQWMGLSFVDDSLLRGLVGTLASVFEHVTVLRPGGAAILFISSDEELDFIETSGRAIAKAPDSFSAIGVHDVTDVVAAIRLEKEASREYSAGYPIITDDHNHLAWMRGRGSASLGKAGKGLQLHDPLPELVSRVSPEALVRRLVARKSEDRARAILKTMPAEARAAASGWLLISKKRPLRAAAFFEVALAANPTLESARIGLAVARGPKADLAALPPEAAAVIEGESLGRRGRWKEVRDLDDQLAQAVPGSLLYPEATRLRIGWRLGLGGSRHGEEALELVEVLSARDRYLGDLVLRAEAARLAGRPDYAWASLSRLANSLTLNSKAKELAREALGVAAEIEPDAHAPVTLRLLRRIAQSSAK